MDAKALQNLYEETFSVDYIETGPRLVRKNRRKPIYVSFEKLLAEGKRLFGDLPFPTKQHQILEVESPWHTLCVGMYLQKRALAEQHAHLLFRGQSNSSHALKPSIFRPGADQPTLERAKQFLAWFLASNSGLKIAIDPSLFYGAAQHYQIWTDLLDVTPDPAIAVWFASLPTDREHPTAAVYVIPLEFARRSGANLRLPPPYIERLHRQRGVFIEFKDATPLPMDEIIEIRFPQTRSKETPFNVIRHGKVVDVLGDDEWIRRVVEWAKKAAENPAIEVPTAVPTELNEDFALFLKGVKSAGIPIERLDHAKIHEAYAKWLDQFNDLLYWLAYRFDDSNKGSEELLEPQHVKILVEHNVELARQYVKAGRSWGLNSTLQFQNQLDVIESVLP